MARKPQPLKSIGSLVLVGAGKMGSAMLEGWLARGLDPKKLTVIEPQPVQGDQGAGAARAQAQSERQSRKPSRVVVIAVKPQNAPEALPALAPYVGKTTLVALDHGRAHHRLYRKGAAAGARRSCAPCRTRRRRSAAASRVAVGNAQGLRPPAQAGDRSAVRHRRGGMGERRGPDGRGDRDVRLGACLRIPAGGSDDARRASPPACRQSLPRKLARETVAGSGELLQRSPLDAATLRQNVTSPGGTTAAALDVLMGPGGFDALLTRAIAAATRRGRELAG